MGHNEKNSPKFWSGSSFLALWLDFGRSWLDNWMTYGLWCCKLYSWTPDCDEVDGVGEGDQYWGVWGRTQSLVKLPISASNSVSFIIFSANSLWSPNNFFNLKAQLLAKTSSSVSGLLKYSVASPTSWSVESVRFLFFGRGKASPDTGVTVSSLLGVSKGNGNCYIYINIHTHTYM